MAMVDVGGRPRALSNVNSSGTTSSRSAKAVSKTSLVVNRKPSYLFIAHLPT
jgi:hypothetical protein